MNTHTELPIGLQRLEKLADHLENGKLGHEVFDFTIYNNSSGPACGTAGCALGECPIVWPDAWKFDMLGVPTLRKSIAWDVDEDASQFFGVGQGDIDHLFYPNKQDLWAYGGKVLDETATASDVAHNIRTFIEIKKQSL